MFEEYFTELDPVKRKEILDGLTPEPGQEETLAQMRALFDVRYKANKKDGFNDGFIGPLVAIRNIAENPRGRTATRRYTKELQTSVHALCLDRTEEFSAEVLYREMCQLIALYIETCRDDGHYSSILFGMGHLAKQKVEAKLQLDMHYLWNPIQKYLGEREEYLPLKNAIIDTKEEKLKK